VSAFERTLKQHLVWYRVKVTSDIGQLERAVAEHGFYVDCRLQRRTDLGGGGSLGHWLTSSERHVVVDDVTAAAAVHPAFADARNNAVFHSLDQVTDVLTQLQVGIRLPAPD